MQTLAEQQAKQERLNYYEAQIIRDQEEARRGLTHLLQIITNCYIDIALFSERNGLEQYPTKGESPSDVLKRLDELDRLGVRRNRAPDLERFVYDTSKPRAHTVYISFLSFAYLLIHLITLI